MSSRAWPYRLSAREGLETARSGRWTSLLVIVAVAWILGAPAAADALGVSRLIDGEQAWIDAGGHVFVVSGFRQEGMENPIPGDVCERLSQIDGIDGAFAMVRTNASGSLSYLPGGRPQLYDVSPGVFEFLEVPEVNTHAALATAGFVKRTGVADGDQVTVIRRPGQGVEPGTSDRLQLSVVDTAIMGEEYDGSLLFPTIITGRADLCFVRTDAAHVRAVEQLLPSVLSWEGKPAIPSPRLFQSEFQVDYTHAYEDRPLRWVWVVSAAALGLLWSMIQWFRRSHVAIYSTFGMQAPSRVIMQVSEWGVLAAFGAVWGWALGVVAAIAYGAHPGTALSVVSFHAILTLLGATAIVILVALRPTGTLLNALKER